MTPTLTTARLVLEPLGKYASDVDDIQRQIVHPEVIKYLVIPEPYPADGAQTFLEMQQPKIADGSALLWSVRHRENLSELIGVIDYRRHETPNEWGRGFWLAFPHHRKGYMTEAINETLQYMFETQGMSRLVVENFLENAGSHRVKEKTGCRFLGVFPMKKPCKGHTQQECWELTRADWLAHKPSLS